MPLSNPFPGLRPFSSKESELFFGRERHIGEIVRKLNLFRFVSIVGTSGSGKSSIVRAGLLPGLEKSDEPWIICKMRPGEDPISAMVHSLESSSDLKGNLPDTDQMRSILVKNSLGLVQIMRSALGGGKKLLLLVDQFEEIFRYIQPDSEEGETDYELDAHFVDILLASVDQKDISIYVILTLRSDFLGDCEQFMGLPEAINDGQFLIPRMNKDELKLCITGPINAFGKKASPRLIQHLVEEVGPDPDRLPVLQHILMRTWEVWSHENELDKPIDLDHYLKTGGMDNALSIHAEEAYSELKDDRERKIAEILFKTITVKGADNRGIRRPTSVQNVAKIAEVSENEVISVANIFRKTGRGFIMPPSEVSLHSESILDISHESLMRVWKKLSEWVEEEAESAELYYRITNNALLYEQDKAGLWRDPDLQIALDWRDKQKHNEYWARQYNEHFKLAQTFIEASHNDKKYFLAEIQRKRKLQRAVVITFLISLSALSVWAYFERNRSVKNAVKAIEEKKESEKQKKYAEEQKHLAELSLKKAVEEENKAQQQRSETEKQRIIALKRAEEAKQEREKAEAASKLANAARESAVKDRNRAENQRLISDSLRKEAVAAESKALRLQMLSLAQTLAIKSKLAQDYTFDESVKALLALQAYDLNNKYGGDKMDPEIFAAIFSAYRLKQNKQDYMHREHHDVLKSISFNSSSNEIASVGNDGVVIMTDIYSKPIKVRKSESMSLFLDNVTFSPDGSALGVSCDNNSLRFFDVSKITSKQSALKDIHSSEIMDIIWTNDYLITASLDQTVKIHRGLNGGLIKTIDLKARPLSMALSSDGSTLIVGCDNGKVYRIDPSNSEPASEMVSVGKGRINGICLNSTSSLFAIGTDEGYSAVYSLSSPSKPISILSGHKAGITGVTFHPSLNLLATSSWDQVVRLWNVDELNPHPIEFKEHTNWVMDVTFDGKGEYLASAGRDKSLIIYPIRLDMLANELRALVNRKLTKQEWLNYVSEEVPYESITEK